MSIKTILIDDEKSFLEQSKIFLDKVDQDIEVHTAISPKKAFEMMDEKDFDVIVSDYQMPEKDGLEFLEELREEREIYTPFIIFTGKGREKVAIKALNLGADRYIQKGGEPESEYGVLVDAIVQEYESWESKRRLEESKEELKESRKKYKKIFHETPLGVFHYDEEGVITECNDKFVEIIGSSREALIGLDMLNDLENDKLIDEVRSSLEEGEGYYEGEYTSVTGDKTIIVRVLFQGIEFESGEIDSGIALIEDITERKKAEEEIKFRENLERLITEISTDLVNIQVEETDESIDQALEKIGEFAGADRSYVFKFDEDLETMDMIHEWCDNGIEPQKENMQNFSTNNLPWLMEKVKRFENITIPKVTGLPPEAKSFEELLLNQNIKSLLVLPIISDKNLRGLIGFDWVKKEEEWSEDVVGLLRIAGETIANALDRKEMEEKLRDSKQRLDLALKGAELGIWDWDIKTDDVRYNEIWAEMLGHSLDEIEQDLSSWKERLHPDERQRVIKELEKHLEGKTDLYKTEHRMKTKSGDWIWVKDVGKVFERNETGKPVRAVGILEDITERKRSERKLKQREEKYRTIFESANDAIFIVNKNIYIDCNEKALKMFRCDRDDIIGESPFKFSPDKQPDGRDSKKKGMEKINAVIEGEPQEFEWVHITKDGEPLYTEVTLNKYRTDGEKFVMGIVRDISDRKEAEKRIQENKNKIERLSEISAAFQTCQSEDEVYSFAVEAAEDILEFDYYCFDAVEVDKFVKKGVSSDVNEELFTERQVDEDCIEGKAYLNQESYLIDDLSEYNDLEVVKNKFRSAISVPISEHGVFQAFSKKVGAFNDEDLKIAKNIASHISQTLERIKGEEREEFLHSILRHDLGNKARIANGYLNLMKDSDSPKEKEVYREKTKKAVVEAQKRIEKIRKLRKIGEGEIFEIDLNSIIYKVVSEHQYQLKEKGISIDIGEFDFKVKGGALLGEMFSNLIENSILHSGCEKIKLSSRLKEDEYVVTVEDDGVGISEEIEGKIFEKGFKNGESAGTGLGLYMVKEIAESYDGSVEAKDSELGGARFDIKLKKYE